jgi:hypothetical protein
MRPAIPLALMLLLGCAGGNGAAGGCAANEVGFQRLIGGTLESARATLERMPGVTSIRVGTPGSPMTRDFRPNRATVTVEGDTVRSIACG